MRNRAAPWQRAITRSGNGTALVRIGRCAECARRTRTACADAAVSKWNAARLVSGKRCTIRYIATATPWVRATVRTAIVTIRTGKSTCSTGTRFSESSAGRIAGCRRIRSSGIPIGDVSAPWQRTTRCTGRVGITSGQGT